MKKSDKIYYLLILSFFLFLIIFRFHNALSFNPYWGYDGGGHIDYIFSLAKENKMPDINENYIAWHEPFYYFIFAGFLKIVLFFKGDASLGFLLKSLGCLQAVLSILTSIIILKLASLLTKKRLVTFLILVLVSLLPSMNQASTFLTNELLNYFFLFLISYYFLKYFVVFFEPSFKKFIILGIVLGLGLLIKITVLILGILFLAYLFFYAITKKDIKTFDGFIISVFIVVILVLPWQVYRYNNVSDSFSINNVHFLKPQPLKLDERIDFFTSFDENIFKFPYYPSGDKSFMSMLFGDSFFDYYGTIENKDYTEHLLKNKEADKLIKTSNHAEVYVTKKNYRINRILSWMAILFFVVFILGLIYSLVRFLKRKEILYFFFFAVPLSFLLALIYYAYRYPYYDHGIVKAIFIFPAFIFLIIPGLEYLNKLFEKMIYIFTIFILLYAVFIVKLYWIVKFNY